MLKKKLFFEVTAAAAQLTSSFPPVDTKSNHRRDEKHCNQSKQSNEWAKEFVSWKPTLIVFTLFTVDTNCIYPIYRLYLPYLQIVFTLHYSIIIVHRKW